MSSRRGAALPLALVAILVSGSLAALALAAARLHWLDGERQLARVQAESQVWSTAVRRSLEWDHGYDTLPVGTSEGWPAAPGSSDSIYRLGTALFQARATAMRRNADGSVLARAGGRALVQWLSLRLPDDAAVVSSGPVLLTGAGVADGADHTPPGWDSLCPPPGAAGPGSRNDPLGPAGIGPVTIADAIRWAEVQAGGVVTGAGPVTDSVGRCDRASGLNWGSPGGGPCLHHLPIIVAQPGTRLEAGAGQGLLVALGGVELANDFFYAGAIVSLGPLRISGHSRVLGTVFSGDTVTILDSARVERSRCAVQRALMGAARPYLRPERWWSSGG